MSKINELHAAVFDLFLLNTINKALYDEIFIECFLIYIILPYVILSLIIIPYYVTMILAHNYKNLHGYYKHFVITYQFGNFSRIINEEKLIWKHCT